MKQKITGNVSIEPKLYHTHLQGTLSPKPFTDLKLVKSITSYPGKSIQLSSIFEPKFQKEFCKFLFEISKRLEIQHTRYYWCGKHEVGVRYELGYRCAVIIEPQNLWCFSLLLLYQEGVVTFPLSDSDHFLYVKLG